MARIESGAAGVAASHWDGAVLVAAGREPFELIRRGVAAAARLSGALSGCWLGGLALLQVRLDWVRMLRSMSYPLPPALAGTARPRSEKPVPPSCDVFGWCSWDA